MWLPGDPKPKDDLAPMLRVDQAGEYGAKRIYEGQLAALKPGRARETVREMLHQELAHLAAFDRLLIERRVRPSLMMPLWHGGGWLLGFLTAKLGHSSAMACTVAVESVIDAHYAAQEEALGARPEEAELKALIARFRAEEGEHHDTGLAEGAEKAPFYALLTGAIRALTGLSIRLAQRF